MKLSLAAMSLALFLISVAILILLTVFEAALTGLSLSAERWLSFILLVLPAVVGLIFGIVSITRREPKRWVGILGIVLNALFALFHVFLLSFAG